MDDSLIVRLQLKALRAHLDRRFDKLFGQLRLQSGKLNTLEKMEMDQTQQLAQLQADVAAEDSVIASAVTLIQGISDRINQAGGDPAALAALSADIQAQAATLAAAVAANTPGAPPPSQALAQAQAAVKANG